MQHRQHSGFTIVELIVVIVVIAILASISYVTYAGIQDRAVNTVLQSGLRNANTQVQLATVDGENTACSSLKANDNTTYQCTPDPIAPGSDYCITVTSTNRPGAGTFRLDQNGAIQSGACPGHSSTGTPVVVATDASCFVTRDVTSSTVAITEYRGGGWESSGYRTVPYLSECPADVVIPSQIGGKTVVRLESTGSYGG